MAPWYLFYSADGEYEVISASSRELAKQVVTSPLRDQPQLTVFDFDHQPSMLEALIAIRFGPWVPIADTKAQLVVEFNKSHEKIAATRARQAFATVFKRTLKTAEAACTYEITRLAKEA